ncbi:DNA-(apurinic or apyrimidinic site) lyase 2 [Tetranychus urticae]|uniref:DNA-(apurinic or apyrimidinic site) lyase 2 n=1 Tax=Tetranychus urticae TaxID=32264 RepID=UPI00077BEA6D|nr:DNA-(apurinic or apyrimidinic site) lyase 2 [Tetranychus urticae]
MRITSWNINGIRSFKTPIKEILNSLDSDVLCFQETKISRNQVDEFTAIIQDYVSFFSFPKYQSGYSGVATYCKNRVKPYLAQDCFLVNGRDTIIGPFHTATFTPAEVKDLDKEGRVIVTGHQCRTKDGNELNLFIFNLYCPHNDPDRPERSIYKLSFHRLLEEVAHHILKADKSNHVLIIGDINISHQRIDHCDPADDFEESPHRAWLSEFLSPSEEYSSVHFIDIFRQRHPKARNAFTCWNTKNLARKTNFGTRIDFALCDDRFYKYVTDFEILTQVEGSDHCPIRVTFGDLQPLPSQQLPKICTKFWPELGQGKRQTSIKGFLMQTKAPQDEKTICTTVSKTLIKPNIKPNNKPNKKNKQDGIRKYFKTNEYDRSARDDDDSYGMMEPEIPSYDDQIVSCNDSERLNYENRDNKCLDDKEKKDNNAAKIWKMLLPGTVIAPLCSAHKEPCILLTVNKPGPNKGRKFYACSRPTGFKNDPASSCEFFKWYKS